MQMKAGDSARQQICPRLCMHTHFPSTRKLLTAHRCLLRCASGFSDILLNHAGPESQKCKSCHFSFSFHLCQPLTSLPSIQWLFSTLSHKGAVCLERAGAPAGNHCSALRLKVTTEMTGKLCFSLQKGISNCSNGRQWANLTIFFFSLLFSSHHYISFGHHFCIKTHVQLELKSTLFTESHF